MYSLSYALQLICKWVFLEALQDLQVGIKVNGRVVNNICYANNTVLNAGNPHDLRTILDTVNIKGRNTGLKKKSG